MARDITYQQAQVEAMAEEMRRDSRVIQLCGSLAGLGDLVKEFGTERVRVCPISEAAYTGAAIGAAACGYRPVVNWGRMTFAFTAMDQIVNQAAKLHYMFGGQVPFPIVFRAGVGAGMSGAAQHSQSPHPMFMNLAGLKLVMPCTPYDAKGLLKSAIRENNPVVFFEHAMLSSLKGPVPDDEYVVPLGQAEVKCAGTDITLVAVSRMVLEALAAAEELATEGVSAEVVDPRTLVPMDAAALRRSVRKTGRVVIVDEACITGAAAAEISALLTEDPETFRALKSPPRRVCAPDVPIPYSPVMEQYVIPGKQEIVKAARAVLAG
ncbi:MAG: alpha-ketoacid dehydrogenase subunit beta [Chloroflexi bacterium]|nr:alpha-ketoacid dehydrogenase subunit beta [Chloroflexota bacterium]